ncbi:MAG: TusE/DsrC/DsvC family sulfur relay protein [Thiomargarita sp.]|nr:TusE/DsrC/DsvC family sulfur relay protein [Thiomargarita sp.]
MSLVINENTIEIDAEGYLVEPAQWNKEVAEELARQEEITLTEEHWKILYFMRSYYRDHQVAADVRFVTKYMSEEFGIGKAARNYLFKLFPYGYVKQACKISGMKRPRAWSTG